MRVAEIPLVEVSSNMHVFLISTAVDCGTITNPNNGQVSHTGETTFGQSATYSCNTGYNLVEAVFACVKLQENGLGVHLPVKVCCFCLLIYSNI